MKIRFLLLVFLAFIATQVFSQANVNEYLNQITIQKIKTRVETLASESMEGRYTGEKGQKLAASYISGQFASFGLNPFTESENPYFQKFVLNNYKIGVSALYYNKLVYPAPVYIGSKDLNDSISDDIVFAGYAEDDDLKNLPIENNSIYFLSKSIKDAIQKSTEITKKYHVNVCIVGIPFGKDIDPNIFNGKVRDLESFKELYYYHNYYILKKRNQKDFEELQQNNKLIPNIRINSEADVKILFVPEELAAGLFQRKFEELKSIAKKNNKSGIITLEQVKPAHFSLKVNYSPQIVSIQTENVIGYIDSENTDDVIILGAHYDHVGRNSYHEINYGADDNASGTTGMLTVAELFSQAVKAGNSLKYDMVFIAYSAEELGLHGSEYYVQNPLFPLSKTDVIFNLDMIGRNMDDGPENSNRIFLLKWKGGKKYIRKVNKLNNEYTHLIVDTNPGLKNRMLWTFGSDHYSFVQKDISSVTYFTGLHKDYHTSRDTPDKLNYDKMKRIIQLVFLNIWDLSITNN